MSDTGRAIRCLLPLPAILAGTLLPSDCLATLAGPGDIAFVRLYADDPDAFSIVLLADADAGQEISFSTAVYHPMYGFGSGDHIIWDLDTALPAGTIVTFSNLSFVLTPPIVSAGSIRNATNEVFSLNAAGVTIHAYTGTDHHDPIDPSRFLAGISTESVNVFSSTGLVVGDTAIYLPPKADEIDEGHYTGPRDTQMSFSDYRGLIGNVAANWVTRDNTGTVPEFDPTDFTLANGYTTPESPRVILGNVMALGVWFWIFRRTRRRHTAPSTSVTRRLRSSAQSHL